MVDLSVFGKFKTKSDFDRAEQEFRARKQAAIAQATGQTPAAIQIADEFAKARAAGDLQRMNDLAIAAKSFDKGILQNPDGSMAEIDGYGQAVGGIAAAKAGMSQQAKKNVDFNMNPQIANVTEAAKVQGKNTGTKQIELKERMAGLPQLEDTAQKLSSLGKAATYTLSGQARDTVMRELGAEVPDAAVARAEYISMVDNQILPLLRQTFGAQFTEREGQSLKSTLGNPNLSPAEKDAVLRSFIDQKKATINSMEREIGIPPTSFDELQAPQEQSPAMPPQLPLSNYQRAEQEFNAKKPKVVNWEDLP